MCDERVKPSRDVKVGETLAIRIDKGEWIVSVPALSDVRGSAKQAALLYEENAESLGRREASRELRSLQLGPTTGRTGSPTTRDRRKRPAPDPSVYRRRPSG